MDLSEIRYVKYLKGTYDSVIQLNVQLRIAPYEITPNIRYVNDFGQTVSSLAENYLISI